MSSTNVEGSEPPTDKADSQALHKAKNVVCFMVQWVNSVFEVRIVNIKKNILCNGN